MRKKILFVASECVPFIKTGGLADVVGSLPQSFDTEQYDIRVVLPKYLCIPKCYRSAMEPVSHFYMYYNGRDRYVGILRMVHKEITYYFVDNEEYFSGNTPYTDPFYDLEKFGFFSKASLAILPSLKFQPDLIHCHDWHTGLVPVYLRTQFSQNPFYAPIRTIMTIHNLRFQGVWNIPDICRITGLPEHLFTPDKLEAYGNANYLKGGLVYANAITTVSHSYVSEVQTPFYGEGLHGLLWARRDSFHGILNGIDDQVYNPATDECIAAPFTAENFRQQKKKNKAALQKELGLAEDSQAMLIGIVSRMTDQKGFDLIAPHLEELLEDHIQFAILGTGEPRYEEMFRSFSAKYPQKVSAHLCYSEPLSHRIYAGCDAFLMPSLFEPCGLSQLIALRYGTVPIVRETGGLKDTVVPYNQYDGTGTGFSFANYNAQEMMDILRYAKQVFFAHKSQWDHIVEQGMQMDFSWRSSAKQYQKLYDDLLL